MFTVIFSARNSGKEIPYEDAVLSWIDNIYLPMIAVIRDQAILKKFPERTEADLYLWIIEHLAFIRQQYPDGLEFEEAAIDFSREKNSLLTRILQFFRSLFG